MQCWMHLASYACPENPVSLPDNYSLKHGDIPFLIVDQQAWGKMIIRVNTGHHPGLRGWAWELWLIAGGARKDWYVQPNCFRIPVSPSTGIKQPRVSTVDGEKPSKNGFTGIFLQSVFIVSGTKGQVRAFSCPLPFISLLKPWEEHCSFPPIP